MISNLCTQPLVCIVGPAYVYNLFSYPDVFLFNPLTMNATIVVIEIRPHVISWRNPCMAAVVAGYRKGPVSTGYGPLFCFLVQMGVENAPIPIVGTPFLAY